MNATEWLSAQPVAQAIGVALLHFVWQGAVIGVITAASLAALRRSAPDVRYVVASIGLSLMLTIPVVSAVQAWRLSDAAPTVASGAVLDESVHAGRSEDRGPAGRPGERVEVHPAASVTSPQSARASWIPALVLAWLCGVSVLSLRLASGWIWVCRMKSHGTAPAQALQDVAARLVRTLHVRETVRFLQSTQVDVPTVIGWLKPVVLIPASALSALSPQQLEAIIAHELAHIRRHDYLVNLLQAVVETLLFYHPAVWWLSRRIRIEREHCCDDLAVSLCGDPVVYARALADLEELRSIGRLALAASGGSLLQRVRRVLGAPSHAGRAPGWLAGTAAILLMAAIAAGSVVNAALEAEGETSAAQAADAPVVPAAAPAAEAPPARAEAATRAVALPAEAQARAIALEQLAPRQAAQLGADHARAFEEAAAALAAVGTEVAAAAPVQRARADGRQTGNFIWSNGNEKVEVNYSGTFEFTDDDRDVRSVSPGGWLKISERRARESRTVEFRADGSGAIERRFWIGSSERPFEPEGREWLAGALPRLIRQSGLGAPARVARILRTKGVDGVLAEISLIEGSWARRVYYTALLEADGVDPRAVEQIVARAGQDLVSDFELASLLIDRADRLLGDDGTRRAYFQASGSIASDFELRRVLSSALKRGSVSPDLLARLLDAGMGIESDFEAASLLIQVAKLQPLDERSRPAFFRVLASVDSDFEHRRVLNTLVSRTDIGANTLGGVLTSAASIASDFEQASLLLTVLRHHSIEGANRDVFFRAVDSIGSNFERGRVLRALADRPDASPETVMDILHAAKAMNGTHETAQVLRTVAGAHPLTGAARDLFIDIAERLGEYERGRVLYALIKNEK